MNYTVENALQTLLQYDRTPKPKCGRSQMALMREFLRREALWVKWLEADQNELPFADLAALVDSSARCENNIIARARSFPHSSAEGRCCNNFLHWSALKEAKPDLVKSFGLPDPYEPLLKLWERGGFFSREHRVFIDVSYAGGLHSGMVAYLTDLLEPIVALDDQILDDLDKAVV